jgi:hypothetical protein
MAAEGSRVSFIEGGEIRGIPQPNGGLERVTQRESHLLQDTSDVLKGLDCLPRDIRRRNLSCGIEGELAGYEDERTGLNPGRQVWRRNRRSPFIGSTRIIYQKFPKWNGFY